MLRKSILAGAAALAMVSTAAVAAVTFDPGTGIGFVGKGDVQIAFGWNNAQLQNKAAGVTFAYDAVDTYDVECYWETTTGGPNPNTIVHDITVPRHTSVFGSLNGSPRQERGQTQFTGFNLTGYGSSTTNGTVPVVGGACPGASSLASIVAVTLVSSTGGLTATSEGVTKSL